MGGLGSSPGSNTFANGIVITGGTITTSGNDLTITPDAGQITNIGDADNTSHSLVANDDLFISGKLEVDGKSYFDGTVEFTTAVYLGDSDPFVIGRNSTVNSQFKSVVASEELLLAMHNRQGRNFILTEYGNRSADHGHAESTDPTLWIHSATLVSGDDTQWMSLKHNQTDAELLVGKGGLLMTAPTAAPTRTGASQVAFYIDEGTNDLKCVVRYSDGSTDKAGTVCALV